MTLATGPDRVFSSALAMVSGMNPELRGGSFYFCSTQDDALAVAACPHALSMFREDEGLTLVLAETDATRFGFQLTIPMRRIVLNVFSALDGVGLTAAVSTALAQEGIPCNMVAAYHHDHVFVPANLAEAAISILRDLQSTTGSYA